jgi:hypothetical protein
MLCDAVEARSAAEKSAGTASSYKPKVNITIDLVENALTVTDNGVGLDKDKFEQFLAPNFSFKSGDTRGHKGVGATYVAYGFNFMRVATKSPGFSACGRIVGARNWLRSNATGANPKVEPDDGDGLDPTFTANDRGVSITVRFDDSTHPRRLDWIQASTAENWWKILTVKTALGAISADPGVQVTVKVHAKAGDSTYVHQGTGYLWLYPFAPKKARLRDIIAASDAVYKKAGVGGKLPDKFTNLDFIYESWTADELRGVLKDALDAEEADVLERFEPTLSMEFGYTARLWAKFNESLGIRSGYNVLAAGIQLAANNMPQGETIQIPLRRYTGRQQQLHFLFHFRNYTPDLGRKGFNRELSDFAKTAARYITDNVLAKQHYLLKANTGAAPDLAREIQITDWKKEMIEHEHRAPLKLNNKHFFVPTERISVTSAPTREQDVIALFHQLIAGGVIRGVRVMSTNERLTYDGLFRIAFDLEPNLYIYQAVENPLGVSADVIEALHGKITEPMVLEYKFCLDGLVEDLEARIRI